MLCYISDLLTYDCMKFCPQYPAAVGILSGLAGMTCQGITAWPVARLSGRPELMTVQKHKAGIQGLVSSILALLLSADKSKRHTNGKFWRGQQAEEMDGQPQRHVLLTCGVFSAALRSAQPEE
jgi:hypothetical protein